MTQTPEQKAARRAIKGVGPDTDLAGNPLTEEQKATMREVEARWAKEDAAKAHPIAALIAGVPRWSMIEGTSGTFMARATSGEYLHVSDVLAALEAVQPPDLVAQADDLLPDLQRAADDGDIDCKEAVRLIRALIALATAQAAQIAGLNACIEQLQGPLTVAALTDRADAAEAEAATLRAADERLTRKVARIADEIDEQVKVTRAYVADCGMDRNQQELMAICTSHFIDSARGLRAALEGKA